MACKKNAPHSFEEQIENLYKIHETSWEQDPSFEGRQVILILNCLLGVPFHLNAGELLRSLYRLKGIIPAWIWNPQNKVEMIKKGILIALVSHAEKLMSSDDRVALGPEVQKLIDEENANEVSIKDNLKKYAFALKIIMRFLHLDSSLMNAREPHHIEKMDEFI